MRAGNAERMRENLSQRYAHHQHDETMKTALLKIRTVTAFVTLRPELFTTDPVSSELESVIGSASLVLKTVQQRLIHDGDYSVQTVRIATNPFDEWLLPQTDDETSSEQEVEQRLGLLDSILGQHDIDFCSLGPAQSVQATKFCPIIVASSPRMNCSVDISSAAFPTMNIDIARAAARCIRTIAHNEDKSICSIIFLIFHFFIIFMVSTTPIVFANAIFRGLHDSPCLQFALGKVESRASCARKAVQPLLLLPLEPS